MIHTFIQYITLLFLCCSFFVSTSLFADNNVTSTTFTVDLATMDPLGSTRASGSEKLSGGIESFKELLGSITDILLFMIPIFAAVSLMIAGYFYIFSAGDSEKAGRAKTIIKWNIVAILVAFLSYGIVSIVASFFNT